MNPAVRSTTALPAVTSPAGADPSVGERPSPDDVLDLAAVVDRVRTVVPYLGVSLDAPAADGWIPCADLIGDTDRVLAEIVATADGRHAPDRAVAGSLFVQSYAFRVGALVLAPFALGLPTPSCSPRSTFVRIARDRPASVAITSTDVAIRSVDDLVTELVVGHLAPFVDTVHLAVTIGRRLLWGNVAASCASVFRAIEGATDSRADALAVRARADRFMAAAQDRLAGLGHFDTVDVGDRDGWFWTRTNCCLWYRCTDTPSSAPPTCDDCSLIPADTLAATRLDLVGSTS